MCDRERGLRLGDQKREEKDRFKPEGKGKKDPSALKERGGPQHPSCAPFLCDTQQGTPSHVLFGTDFIKFSIKAKLDSVRPRWDGLCAMRPSYTDCIVAETERLGRGYRVALRIAKDE